MEEDSINPSSANLLDRVLQSQQTETLEHFDPLETVNELLKLLSSKEADVLRRRYGLGATEAETLETIGQTYKVTRERVRQIQHWSIKHLKQAPTTKHILHGLTSVLQQLLESSGGLMVEEDLLQRLQGSRESSTVRKAAVRFLLEQLLDDKVQAIEEHDYKPYWKLLFVNQSNLHNLIASAKKILVESGKPLTRSDLIQRLQKVEPVQGNSDTLTEEVILNYLAVSAAVEHNPFGEIGLRNWGTIVPKRMHDKILLVMRKHGKPMHFHDITKKINEIGFDHRQAYPPTVHNELILNSEYVLVGRGIYALREWGYQPGVVADVLQGILRNAAEPMTRDELISKVLEQRIVKKNTVSLALTNKNKFRRLADGRYTLAEAPATPVLQ